MTYKGAHSNTAFSAPVQADRLSGVSVTNSNYSPESSGWEKGGIERLVQSLHLTPLPSCLKGIKDKPKRITAKSGNTIK